MADRPRIKTKHPGVYYRETDEGRQYIIWFKGTDGKPRFQNVDGGERDAVRARARIIDRMAHGHNVAPGKLTIAEWMPRWLEEKNNIKPKTRQTYGEHIRCNIVRLLGHHRVCDLNVNHVAGFVAQLREEGKAGSTINGALAPLSGAMRTAVRRGMAPANPVSQLDRHERPQSDTARMEILDSEEIKKFLDSATPTYKILLSTAVFTGMRVGELLELKWEDVDWDAGILHVRDSKTKAGRREVVLMPSLKQLLMKHHLQQHPGATYVFETKDGRQQNRRNIHRNALTVTLKKAGITKRIRFHDLRHTFASILIDQGHNETFICEQLGHANAAITRRIYAHLFDRDARRAEARDKLETAFGQVLGN